MTHDVMVFSDIALAMGLLTLTSSSCSQCCSVSDTQRSMDFKFCLSVSIEYGMKAKAVICRARWARKRRGVGLAALLKSYRAWC